MFYVSHQLAQNLKFNEVGLMLEFITVSNL